MQNLKYVRMHTRIIHMLLTIPRDQTCQPVYHLSSGPPFTRRNGILGSIFLQKFVWHNIHHMPYTPLSPHNSKHRTSWLILQVEVSHTIPPLLAYNLLLPLHKNRSSLGHSEKTPLKSLSNPQKIPNLSDDRLFLNRPSRVPNQKNPKVNTPFSEIQASQDEQKYWQTRLQIVSELEDGIAANNGGSAPKWTRKKG